MNHSMNRASLFSISLLFSFFFSFNLWAINVETLNKKIKEYEYVGDFREDRAVVKKDGRVGFINKNGELVIPFKWEAFDNYTLTQIHFKNGICHLPNTKNSKAYIIDKNGNELYSGSRIQIDNLDELDIIYVYEGSQHSVYFADKESVKKMEQYENDEVICDDNYNFNNINTRKRNFFTLEKLCNGNVVGKKILEEKYGYKMIKTNNCSFDNTALLTLLNIKKNKYGIVDQKGNVVVPFKYNHPIFMVYGLMFEVVSFPIEGDITPIYYPVYTNVYKNGRLLHEKLPFLDEVKAINGIFMFMGNDINDIRERFGNSGRNIQIPESVGKTIFLDIDGNVVSRFPFGKNYLRFLHEGDYSDSWVLEDKEGKLVCPQKIVYLYSRFQNSIVVEFEDDGTSYILTDTGAIIPESFSEYVKAGIIKLTDKSQNDFPPLLNENKFSSEKDKYLNCNHFSKSIEETRENRRITKYKVMKIDGTELLPIYVDEVYSFSDGLLRLRSGKRYFFVDEKGQGVGESK